MNPRYLWFLGILLAILVPSGATGQSSAEFFYGNGCPHCAVVEPYIDQLEQIYPDIIFNRYETYDNRGNLLLLEKKFSQYDVPIDDRGVPAVFVNDKYLVGDQSIIQNLEPLLVGLSEADSNEENREVEPIAQPGGLKGLTITAVVGAAFVDSINPCAIAVLLILLSALIVTGNKKRVVMAGLAFSASIYISYFLFGLGLFSALAISGLSFWFERIVGFLAILIGLANIKDYFWYGGAGFVTEIPRAWRPTLKGLLGKVTSPAGAFAMGFLVSLFELPCTGGPYLVILGLLAEETTRAGAIPILLLYNAVFILPLLVVILLVYLGRASVDSITDWKDKNIRRLHLVAGIIMLLLGLAVVGGVM